MCKMRSATIFGITVAAMMAREQRHPWEIAPHFETPQEVLHLRSIHDDEFVASGHRQVEKFETCGCLGVSRHRHQCTCRAPAQRPKTHRQHGEWYNPKTQRER